MNTITLPYLKKGTKDSKHIIKLQTMLQQQGNWEKVISGRFGPELEGAVAYFQQTHLGPDGFPLMVDGEVGSGTWWALHNPSGANQRSYIEASIPDGLSGERAWLLEVAMNEHGTVEVPNGSNRGPGLDKYLPKWISEGNAKGPAWCCFYVSWVTKAAFGKYPLGKREGSCWSAYKAADKLGMWHKNDGIYMPRPGDAFVMLHGGRKGHIGFVLRTGDTKINTNEGNCGNRVKVGVRNWKGDDSIAGFINFYKDAAVPMAFERGIMDAQNVAADGTR